MPKPKKKFSGSKPDTTEPWSRGDYMAAATLGITILSATGAGGFYLGNLEAHLTTQQEIVDLKSAKTVCDAELASRKSENPQISININGASSTGSGTNVQLEPKQLSRE